MFFAGLKPVSSRQIHGISVVPTSVFGQNSNIKFQTFRQLVNDGTIATNHVRDLAHSSKEARYSPRNYGRIPIVHFRQPFLPLKKPVTLVLNFELLNFGKIDWEQTCQSLGPLDDDWLPLIFERPF